MQAHRLQFQDVDPDYKYLLPLIAIGTIRHPIYTLIKQKESSPFATMSDNVGLSTPRGSGTSGYVQRNLAHIKPRDSAAPYPKDLDSLRHKQRQPDKGILEHDRKREVEVKVFELRDQLEDEG